MTADAISSPTRRRPAGRGLRSAAAVLLAAASAATAAAGTTAPADPPGAEAPAVEAAEPAAPAEVAPPPLPPAPPAAEAAVPPAASRAASGSATLPDPVAGVAPLLAPLDAPLAAASVGAGAGGATVRAAVVPGRAFDRYLPVVSELRLAVSGETAAALTRVVLGTAFDPFAPSSARGSGVLSVAGCSTPQAQERRWELARAETLATRARLELEMASIVVEEARDDLAEVAQLTDDALAERSRGAANAEARLAKALERSRITSQRVVASRHLLEHAKNAASLAIGARNAAAAAVKADDDGRAACEDRALAAAWPRLHGTWLPRVALSAAVDLRPGRSGGDDAAAERDTFGGWRAELGLRFRPHERWTVDVWAGGARARSAVTAGAPLGWSYGGGVTASALWWTFLRGDRASSPDYLHEGFLPGIATGVSGQVLRCETPCAGAVTEAWSATPFLDVRLRPALQLRLAVPVTRSTEGTARATSVAPTVTLAAAFAGS